MSANSISPIKLRAPFLLIRNASNSIEARITAKLLFFSLLHLLLVPLARRSYSLLPLSSSFSSCTLRIFLFALSMTAELYTSLYSYVYHHWKLDTLLPIGSVWWGSFFFIYYNMFPCSVSKWFCHYNVVTHGSNRSNLNRMSTNAAHWQFMYLCHN